VLANLIPSSFQSYKTHVQGSESIKFTAYTDNLTVVLRNEQSLDKGLKGMESFGKIFDLQVNKKKTEILHLHGAKEDRSMGKTIVITGIWHGKPQHKE